MTDDARALLRELEAERLAPDTDDRGVTAEWTSEATLGPPRAVLAWVPDDLEEIPEELDQPDLPEA